MVVKLGLLAYENIKLRVLESRGLRIFGPKRKEVIGGQKSAYKRPSYCAPIDMRVMRSSYITWAGHQGHPKCIQNTKSRKRGVVYGKIILELILRYRIRVVQDEVQ